MFSRYSFTDIAASKQLDFGRAGINNCNAFQPPTEPKPPAKAWDIPVIRDESEFRITIGPAGGDKGYTAITGQQIYPLSSFVTNTTLLFSSLSYYSLQDSLSFLTGANSWGIAFYVNGFLISKIIVERGMNYTFKIQTGDTVNNQAAYHPVYITDDSIGGYKQRSAEDKRVSDKYF